MGTGKGKGPDEELPNFLTAEKAIELAKCCASCGSERLRLPREYIGYISVWLECVDCGEKSKRRRKIHDVLTDWNDDPRREVK